MSVSYRQLHEGETVMPEQIAVLTSRRAYEFAADQLRLTILSTQPVYSQMQQAFQFQAVQVGTPQETFGPVPQTSPPGLVFGLGAAVSPEGQVIPIRALVFEPRRIVLDVAGPSQSV